MSWLKSVNEEGSKHYEFEWTEDAPMTVVSAYEDIVKFYERRTGSSGMDMARMKRSLKRLVIPYQSKNDRAGAVDAMESFVNFQVESEFSL